MRSISYGFSLIELMTVVTILSILSAIAIPCYLDYTKRARFIEALAATEPFKTAVSLAIQDGNPLIELKNGKHGIPDKPLATKNLTSLIVDNGIITATASALANNTTYILTPNNDGSSWSVSGSCVKAGFCET
jgi:prepilin-type N-terminal cleavage/methylation domain-containing protein